MQATFACAGHCRSSRSVQLPDLALPSSPRSASASFFSVSLCLCGEPLLPRTLFGRDRPDDQLSLLCGCCRGLDQRTRFGDNRVHFRICNTPGGCQAHVAVRLALAEQDPVAIAEPRSNIWKRDPEPSGVNHQRENRLRRPLGEAIAYDEEVVIVVHQLVRGGGPPPPPPPPGPRVRPLLFVH